MTRYLLLGGGTAGHVNPLLAVAEKVRETQPESSIVIVGTESGLESRLVPARGFELHTIEKAPFPRRLNTAAVAFPARFERATRQVRELIRRHHIDVVIGFGGYASAPGYRAAKQLNIPIVVHEANAIAGLANRYAARHTRFVGVTFANTNIAHATLVGMPTRAEIERLVNPEQRAQARAEALGHFGLSGDRPTLLVTGGSQGARTLNVAVSESVAAIVAAGWQVLHVWGQLTQMPTSSEDVGSNYHILPYCERMDLALAVADVAISRAGSSTVSELALLGIPSVLVPYPVGNGEQAMNAEDLVRAGGAIRVDDSQFSPDYVRREVLGLLTDETLRATMAARAASVGHHDATTKLLQLAEAAVAASGTV